MRSATARNRVFFICFWFKRVSNRFSSLRAGTRPVITLAEHTLICGHKKSAGLHHTHLRFGTTSISLWEACALGASLLGYSCRASCKTTILQICPFTSEVPIRGAIEQMKCRACFAGWHVVCPYIGCTGAKLRKVWELTKKSGIFLLRTLFPVFFPSFSIITAYSQFPWITNMAYSAERGLPLHRLSDTLRLGRRKAYSTGPPGGGESKTGCFTSDFLRIPL